MIFVLYEDKAGSNHNRLILLASGPNIYPARTLHCEQAFFANVAIQAASR